MSCLETLSICKLKCICLLPSQNTKKKDKNELEKTQSFLKNLVFGNVKCCLKAMCSNSLAVNFCCWFGEFLRPCCNSLQFSVFSHRSWLNSAGAEREGRSPFTYIRCVSLCRKGSVWESHHFLFTTCSELYCCISRQCFVHLSTQQGLLAFI